MIPCMLYAEDFSTELLSELTVHKLIFVHESTPRGGGGGGVLTYYGKRGSAALMGDFSAKSP